jgi:hypothetical protein
MPTADEIAAIIASLPPLAFIPAAEATVAMTRWYLVAPIGDNLWLIAHREENGWFGQDGCLLDTDPLVVAELPRMVGGHRAALKYLADVLAQEIEDGELDEAERSLDELRDELRARRRAPEGL